MFAPRPKLCDPSPLTRPPHLDWMAAGRARRPGLALAGVGLLALVAGGLRASRRVLS
jgi:hypothetical protein